MSTFFLKIFEKLQICPKSRLTSPHLCPSYLLPVGIYPFRLHSAFAGRIYPYWAGPPTPTKNHIIVDLLACNLLFFFQQCWTFSPFWAFAEPWLPLHLLPSFPPCSLPGTQTTVQCSLASKWVWPWERCAGGYQGERKENEVGGSFLTFSLRGYVRLATAVEGSSLHLSRYTLQEVGPDMVRAHFSCPVGLLPYLLGKSVLFVLSMSSVSLLQKYTSLFFFYLYVCVWRYM